MTAGTHSDLRTTGLIPRHAYSIISSAVVEDNEGVLCNLVKLRNPTGERKWVGDWSSASPKWPLDISQRLQTENDERNGIFWISYDDFTQHFADMSICKYEDSNEYSYQAHVGTYGMMKVYVRQPGSYVFSLTQYKNEVFEKEI